MLSRTGHVLDAPNVRHGRPRSGRDDDASGGEVLAALEHEPAVAEPRLRLAVVERGVVGEQLDVLLLAQRLDQIVLGRGERLPVGHARLAFETGKAPGRARRVQRLGRADHRLRGHAADVDAGAPDRAVSEERDGGALARGGDRRGEARGARPDDGEIDHAHRTASVRAARRRQRAYTVSPTKKARAGRST